MMLSEYIVTVNYNFTENIVQWQKNCFSTKDLIGGRPDEDLHDLILFFLERF